MARTRRTRLAVEALDRRDLPSAAYFFADDGVHGNELWKSDGTPAGTVMVKDINPAGDCLPSFNSMAVTDKLRPLTALNGSVYFYATDGVHGYEPWKSDGTAAGTVMLADVNPGAAGSVTSLGGLYSEEFAVVGNTVYFTADDGTNGPQLWKTDGTPAGTARVADPNAHDPYQHPFDLTPVGGVLYFGASTQRYGRELWRTDGTPAGTSMVKDISSGKPGGLLSLTAVGSTLYMCADDGRTGPELWKSDGTAAGTALVKDIYPGSTSGIPNYSFPTHLTGFNGLVYFAANDGVHGRELWKSDGTAAGTVLVADINPGPGSSSPGDLFTGGSPVNGGLDLRTMEVVNGVLYFSADDGHSGPADGSNHAALYRSDGTAAGTWLLAAVSPRYVTGLNGAVYFQGYDAGNVARVWKSDGTVAGTAPVPGTYPPPPQELVAGGSAVWFGSGNSLWTTDGTAAGTVDLADFANPIENLTWV